MARRAEKRRPPLDDDAVAKDFADRHAELDAVKVAKAQEASKDAVKARQKASEPIQLKSSSRV